MSTTEEEEKKGTNWYLVGGIALAAGIGIAAAATVISQNRKKTEVYTFEGRDEEIMWTEDTQYLTGFLTSTKARFISMWNTTMTGFRKIDSMIRGNISQDQTSQVFPPRTAVEAKALEMESHEDEDFYIGN